MLAVELEQIQSEFKNRIEQRAKEKGLWQEGENYRQPIYDGVCDIQGYLQVRPKIMWVLKEGHDSPGEDDNLGYGGGFSLVDCIENYKQNGLLRQNPTYRKLSYVSYSIAKSIQFCDHPDINEAEDEYAKVVKKCAMLNVSKMPSLTRSDMSKLKEEYEIWRDIFIDQIKTYDADVMIFGSTLDIVKKDLHLDMEKFVQYNGFSILSKGKQLFVDSYHPAYRYAGNEYWALLVSVINENLRRKA